MRITFILPGFISIPMGGVKVVHEYANRLAERGHDISLVYPITTHACSSLGQIKQLIRRIYNRVTNINNELYYTPNRNVEVLVVKKAISKYIPIGDAVIAAGWQTARWVYMLPVIHGKKFYFLQHFETYFKSKNLVLKTFQLPMIKIAIAQWIIDELKNVGQTAEGPVMNAIDHREFFIDPESTDRPYDVIAVYHHMNVKGPKDLISTLKALKKQKNISAVVIASRKPIHKFPSWVRVVIRPSTDLLRNLYNSSKIFLHTSHSEGWGLPVMEAMACGCAVVATKNKGVMEYLIHEKNALLAPIKDTHTLSLHVNSLLENDQLRKTLLENGLNIVNSFSWESSVTIFENILIQNTQ